MAERRLDELLRKRDVLEGSGLGMRGGGTGRYAKIYDYRTSGQAGKAGRSTVTPREPGAERTPTKTEMRKEQRRADYKSTQEQGLGERNRRREERAKRFGVEWKYQQGGMVSGGRDYGK